METEKPNLKFWIGVGFVIGLLILIVWLGKPAYRHFKEQRSEVAAKKFMSKGDYRNALLSARQTLILDPTNVLACRVMADLANLSHSPATLDWWRKIVLIDPALENKLALASASLFYESPPFPLATKIIREAPASATNLVAFQSLAAQFALRTKNLAAATAHFEQAMRLAPTNKFFPFNLAILQLNSNDPSTVEAARKTLKQFVVDPDLGTSSRRSLIADRIAHSDFPEALNESTQLLAEAQATLADHLQYLEILRHLKNPDFVKKLSGLRQQSATNALATAEIVDWMNANNLSADAVHWLTNLPNNFQAQPILRLALVNCYLTETNWIALRNFVSNSNWGETDYLRLAFLSRAWAALGQHVIAESDWQAAVGETRDQPRALNSLLELAGQWQMKAAREDLLNRIIKKFPHEHGVQQQLEHLYFAAGDTAKLNNLYALLLESSDDLALKNNFAATSLLLKTNLPTTFTLAQENYTKNSNDPFIVSTYAYSLYLQGQTQAGLTVLEKLKPEMLKQPSVALYYGVLLKAAGKTNKAETFFKIARTQNNLLPEEKSLLPAAPAGGQ
jgi:tetratricopeptide (TPR) repeat protein